MRKTLSMLAAAVVLALGLGLTSSEPAQAQKKLTIALIPGLTTDAFYITMHKGAERAAKALGVELHLSGRAGVQPDRCRCRCSTR